MSVLTDKLCEQIWRARLPLGIAEHRFHPERRWRFDFAWPTVKLAVEVEGGVFIAGRHSRGLGMLNDMEKYNEAVLLGWRVLRVGRQHIKSGEAVAWIARALATREAT